MTRTLHGSLSFTLLSFLLAGCSGAYPEDALDDVDGSEHGVTAMNALTMNALTMNALTMNALTMNGQPDPSVIDARKQLVTYPLTGAQLMSSASAPVMSALSNPELTGAAGSPTRGQLAVDLLKYIYGCAMPAGTSTTINGVSGQPGGTVQLQGSLGLASSWATSACNEECREIVSACVLARVNAFGEPVQISMRSPAYGLQASAAEQGAFTEHEGAFFGNIFGHGQGSSWTAAWEAYACHPTSAASSAEMVAVTHRACARPGGYCPINVLGPCNGMCAGPEGGYTSCSKPGAATAYNPIAVYLEPAHPVCGNAVCEGGEASACPLDCSDALVMPLASPGFTARVVASVANPLHRSTSVIVAGIVEATGAQPAPLGVGDGVTLAQQSPRDMFVVRYEAIEGTNPQVMDVVWAVREPITVEPTAGGPLPMDPQQMAVDPDGDVAVVGKGFLALYDKDTGQRLWRTVDPERIPFDSVWVNPVGDVVASGVKPSDPSTRLTTRYTVLSGAPFGTFGTQVIHGQARAMRKINSWQYEFYEARQISGNRIRVRRLSSDGVELAAYEVQPSGIQQPVPRHLAVDDATGQVVIAGHDAAAGDPDRKPFIAQVSPSGTLSWLNVFQSQLQRKLLIKRLHLHDGNVYVAGEFSGPTDFKGSLGATPLTPAFDTKNDAFVARYDLQNGHAEWARTYGGNGQDSLGAFTVDGTGNLWTFGEFTGAARVNWKQINGSSDGGSDIFMERSYPGHNLALHKPVTQTSTYAGPGGILGTADKAVDGDTNGDFASGSVAATNVQQGSTWDVDLGEIRWVDHVLIYLRTDCCGDPAGLTLLASGTTNADADFGTKYWYTPDPQNPNPRVLRVDNLGNIRYLRIRQAQAKSLGLAEVQVWGH